MTDRHPRPSIFQFGRATDDGHTVTVTGWVLGLCITGCICHRDPATGALAIHQDLDTGDLGLVSHRPGCDCCRPWTADELIAVARDVNTEGRGVPWVSGG